MKICKIHGYLTEEKIKSGIYKGKAYRKCRECENERARKYAAKNKEKISKRDKEYWANHKKEITERRQQPEKLAKRREWDKQNRERTNPYCKEKQRKYKEELADPYVKKAIQNGNKIIRMKDIPPAMVELARVNILVKRKINELRILNRMGNNGKDKKL